jgi:adenosylcobinamide-GDP ribazoletransferase
MKMRAADILPDLRTGLSLCTRLPVGSGAPVGEGEIARASWSFPVVGLVVGLAGGCAYWLAARAHLPPEAAAMLALAATMLVTGALHEDGLADTADGFGGGKTRDRKLEIMRDSRIGTYGACALITSIILRWTALAAITEPRSAMIALIVAHAAARAPLPIFMRLVPPARADGLASDAGQPPPESAAIAVAIGVVCLLVGLGPGSMVIALVILSLVALVFAWLATRQVGGQTGDVLGALEQVSEAAVLLIASSVIVG